MIRLLIVVVLFALAACTSATPTDARDVAYERLSAMSDGPSLKGDALRLALQASPQPGGVFLVQARDDRRNLLWAVIVQPSGESEVSRMAIDR